MKDVISEIILKNVAYSTKDANEPIQEVTIHNVLDDRYTVSIQIGEWRTNIKKEDLKRVIG